MMRMKININTIINLMAILLIWRCNYCTSMFFVNSFYTSGVFFGVFCVWLFLSGATKKDFRGQLINTGWPLMLFLIVNVSLDIIANGSISQESLNYIILFILFSISIYYFDDYEINFKKKVVLLLIIDVFVKQIFSWQQLILNPNILRQMSTSGADYSTIGTLIGDYSFVYACAIMICAVLACIGKKKNKYIEIVLMAFSIFSVLFVVKASFFFAIMLTLVGCVLALFVKNKKTFVIIPIVTLLLLLALRIPLSNVLSDISHYEIWSDVIQEKIQDFSNYLRYGQDGAWMSSMRIDAIEHSMDTFFSYPLLGTQGLNRSLTPGNHSGWLDGLAQYGILRYPLFLLFLFKMFGSLLKNANQGKVYYISIIALVFLGMINPIIFPQLWVILFVFVPFLDSMCTKEEEILR